MHKALPTSILAVASLLAAASATMGDEAKPADASKLSSLYGNSQKAHEFEAATGRILSVSNGASTVKGDEAMQALMTNFVANSSEASNAATMLAGIKQRAIKEFTNNFPSADLDSLVEAARANGYDVQVIG